MENVRALYRYSPPARANAGRPPPMEDGKALYRYPAPGLGDRPGGCPRWRMERPLTVTPPPTRVSTRAADPDGKRKG